MQPLNKCAHIQTELLNLSPSIPVSLVPLESSPPIGESAWVSALVQWLGADSCPVSQSKRALKMQTAAPRQASQRGTGPSQWAPKPNKKSLTREMQQHKSGSNGQHTSRGLGRGLPTDQHFCPSGSGGGWDPKNGPTLPFGRLEQQSLDWYWVLGGLGVLGHTGGTEEDWGCLGYAWGHWDLWGY